MMCHFFKGDKSIANKFNSIYSDSVRMNMKYVSVVILNAMCSIATESVFPCVFKIFGFKYIGVTTFTFQGHVTSSLT